MALTEVNKSTPKAPKKNKFEAFLDISTGALDLAGSADKLSGGKLLGFLKKKPEMGK